LWEGAIETRNTLVHNNGISEITAVYDYPESFTIEFFQGKMLRGNLKVIPQLTLSVVDLYYEWCSNILI